MRLYTCLFPITIVFFLVLAVKPSLAAGFDVPLTIRNSSAVSRHYTAVTSGIPLPRTANITTTDQLQVVNNTGRIIPTQFTVEARWGGTVNDTTKPIKWVLVDVVVKKVRSHSAMTYHLQTGVDNTLPAQPVKIKRHSDSNTMTVGTGAATFELNTKNFNLFQQVYLEPSHTPLLVDGQQIGAIATANNQTYTASNAITQTFTVEQRGPVHSIVLVKGWQANVAGDRLLAYTTRLHFYAGQSYVKVQYGVWNDNVMSNMYGQPDIKEFGSPHTVVFSDLTLSTQLAKQGSWLYVMGGVNKKYWQGNLQQQLELYQDSSGGPQWHNNPSAGDTTFRGFRAVVDNQTVHGACDNSVANKECRTSGWIDLTSDNGGVAVGVRDFWKNFPKNLTAQADGTIEIKLFPDEYSANFELRVGERKTHEIFYYFHSAKHNTKQVAHTIFNLQHPLIGTASAKWYLNSGAFQDSVSYDAKIFSAYEGYNDAAIMYKNANLFLLEDGITGTDWLYGDRPESLGWRNFGDRIAEDETSPNNYPVFTNQQYDHSWWFVYQFIRTLDTGTKRPKLWWQLAQPSVWHQSDVDIVHSRCTGKSEEYMIQHCMDAANPYAVGWAMGGRLTNQWHADPSANVHRHALIDTWSGGVHGMLYYWYLTGDPVAKDGWKELARNTYWRMNNTPCNGDATKDCGPGYGIVNPRVANADWARGGAYAVEILTDVAIATGQEKYFTTAQVIIADMNPTGVWFADKNFQLNSTAAQTGQTMDPWSVALVMKSLGYYLDSYQERFGTVDTTAQDVLLQYADISSRFWQLQQITPSQYRIYETGGYAAESNNPLHVALADGLIWALKYDDGRLDRSRVAAVATEAFQQGSHPWGDYAANTYMTTKTQVMMGIHGWKYMEYALEQSL